VISSFIHSVVGFAIWNEKGFATSSLGPDSPSRLLGLHSNGFLDMAGGSAVHLVGGFAALMCSWFIGKKKDREKGEEDEYFSALGLVVFWFAWYGFNASAYRPMEQQLDSYLATIHSVITATIAPATAGTLVLIVEIAKRRMNNILKRSRKDLTNHGGADSWDYYFQQLLVSTSLLFCFV